LSTGVSSTAFVAALLDFDREAFHKFSKGTLSSDSNGEISREVDGAASYSKTIEWFHQQKDASPS
jgi:hypothetical protein